MDLYDFPQLVADTSAEAAAAEFDRMRNELPQEWMTEEPLRTNLDSFVITPDHSRYTVSVDDVPFECLYFPDITDRLYIMLSAGGTTTRRYPSFMRWKYKSCLKGHLMCIDDPMYYYHPELYHVMWYYGTKDKSYLALLIDLIKNIAAQLGIPAENVTIIGSSGGGYAALYAGNRIDHSSVIAINPQFYPKNWTSTAAISSFKSWGIDLSKNDKFGRNGIVLDNKTSYFLVVSNICSEQDFVQQLGEYIKDKDIKLRYGISQHGNLITWVHNTQFSVPHWVIPEKVSITILDEILRKCKMGYNANELTNISSLFNELLVDKYSEKTRLFEMRDKLIAERCSSETVSALLINMIRSHIERAYERSVSEGSLKLSEDSLSIRTKIFSQSNIIFYIGSKDNIRYQIVSREGEILFRLLIKDWKRYLSKEAYTEALSDSGIEFAFGQYEFVCSTVIDPDDIYGCIDNVIEKSLKLIEKFEFSKI